MGRAPALEPSEAAITAAVMAHWRALGVPNSLVASIPNMRAHGQHGLTKGLPDLLVLAPGLPIGFIELKRGPSVRLGRVSKAQQAFTDLCRELGIPTYITFGRDAPIRLLEEWGAVKRQRAAA